MVARVQGMKGEQERGMHGHKRQHEECCGAETILYFDCVSIRVPVVIVLYFGEMLPFVESRQRVYNCI